MKPCGTIVQPENWLYNENVKWNKIGKSNLAEVLKIHGYDSMDYIFGNEDIKLPADWEFEQGISREKMESAIRMIEAGKLSVDEIAIYSGLSLEQVLELQKGL